MKIFGYSMKDAEERLVDIAGAAPLGKNIEIKRLVCGGKFM